jgi:hypothetical protein
MSIRCVCGNGHVLKVKNAFAGTSGLCPICRALVKVPPVQGPAFSDDNVLDIIGREGPAAQAVADPTQAVDYAAQSGIGLKKTCDRCGKDISAGAHICPYCRTYIANLRDF